MVHGGCSLKHIIAEVYQQDVRSQNVTLGSCKEQTKSKMESLGKYKNWVKKILILYVSNAKTWNKTSLESGIFMF